MSDPADPDGAPRSDEVPFDGGCSGCLLLLMAPCAIFFAVAAFDPDFAASLADSQVRRNLIGAFRMGSVDLGALVLMVLVSWEASKAVRRLLHPRAVWIDGDMVRFHGTLRHKPLPLAALERVTHEAGEIKSILWLEHAGGRRIKVAMVDHDAARAFVAEAARAKAERTFG